MLCAGIRALRSLWPHLPCRGGSGIDACFLTLHQPPDRPPIWQLCGGQIPHTHIGGLQHWTPWEWVSAEVSPLGPPAGKDEVLGGLGELSVESTLHMQTVRSSEQS